LYGKNIALPKDGITPNLALILEKNRSRRPGRMPLSVPKGSIRQPPGFSIEVAGRNAGLLLGVSSAPSRDPASFGI
jgi:hypothetical protein